MLQMNNAMVPASSSNSEFSLVPQLDALALLRIVRRQWPLLAAGAGITLFLGILYLIITPPLYTGTFLVLIDSGKSQILAKKEIVSDHTIPDPGLVDSQVEILKSDSVALSVVRNLKLTKDPEFTQPSGLSAILAPVMAFLSPSDGRPATEADLENNVVDNITSHMKAKRVGVTYVIEVSFSCRDAEKAARIANEIADAYTIGELEAKYQATRRASKWLQDRIKELREQTSAADRAVQLFKSANNIVDTSRGLMSEQQLSDVNGQLIIARASTAEAKARLDRITEVSQGDLVEGSVADALKSEVITRLRAQYLDLAAKESDLSSKYGKDHGAVVNLRNQMNELKRSVREELRRIAQTNRSDYEIALARERSLQQSLDSLVSQAGTTNQAQVQLRDLESSAATYRNLYDSFLQKFEEATQQQTFPVSDARVITAATTPDRPSSPKKMLVIPGSIVLGIIFGFAAALGRELLGNNFRGAEDASNYAGLDCLGILPNLVPSGKRFSLKKPPLSEPGNLGGSSSVSRHVILAPFSRFTETIRNVKVSLDISRSQARSPVVGIVSAVPREGKTTFSVNLALLTAQMGHRTLLIDGDLHNPSLTRLLLPDAQKGLIEILSESCSLSDAVCRDARTNLHFVPAVVPQRQPNSVALLTSKEMIDLLAKARDQYDYVFIDLPPVVPVVDVKAVAHLVDNFIFVIEWGKTTRDVVRDALTNAEQVRERIVGAVLNKAPPAVLKRFEAYKGRHHNNYYIESDAA